MFYSVLLVCVLGIIIRFLCIVIEENLCVNWNVCSNFLWKSWCGGSLVIFLLFMMMWFEVGGRMFVMMLNSVDFFVLFGLISLVIELVLIVRLVLFMV